jgi:hypothetical protein
MNNEEQVGAGGSADGWIEWKGGEMPVDWEVFVDCQYRGAPDEDEFAPTPCKAGLLAWYHDGARDDIIAYRIVEQSHDS